MAQIGITIESINFNGESVDITFNPFSGGSINLGTQTIPYDYLSTNYEGNYSIYIPSVPKTCGLTVGTPPSPTPSPTSSVTPSITPTITPTNTVTPSITPTATPSATITPTPSASTPSGDADATAYLADVVTSGGTVNATITSAVQTLFTDLKAAGVYSKLNNFYPMVGGTAGSHAINANLDKAYDLTFNGGWTHNASGSTSNGSNAYADTSYQPYSETVASATTFGFYNHFYTTSTGEKYNGSLNNVSPQEWLGFRNSTTSSNRIHIGTTNTTKTVNTGQQGMFISSTDSLNRLIFHYNGSLGTPATTVSGPLPDWSVYMGALNLNGGPYGYVDMGFAFFFNSNYRLSSTELNDLATAINDFQTTLGRNTYT